MKTLDNRSNPRTPNHEDGQSGHNHRMTVACCVPMLVIALVLVATGVVGTGFILVAIMCSAMMAMMMRSSGNGRS